jgi:hypothetical protein
METPAAKMTAEQFEQNHLDEGGCDPPAFRRALAKRMEEEAKENGGGEEDVDEIEKEMNEALKSSVLQNQDGVYSLLNSHVLLCFFFFFFFLLTAML